MSKRVAEIASGSGGRKKKGKGRELNISFGSPSQKRRYTSLTSRELTLTRYPSNFVMQELGIKSEAERLLRNLGWLDFLRPMRYAYENLTFEFLSSLTFERKKTGASDLNQIFSFRFLNNDIEENLESFCARLGFACAGLIHDAKDRSLRPENYEPRAFWTQISGQEEFQAKSAKASCIHNPVFRYIHRVMACSIFARGETGTIRADELFCLWAMVNELPVNTCHYMLEHLAFVAEQTKGQVAVGGIVTYIAEKFGVDINQFGTNPVRGEREIDFNTCVTMKLIKYDAPHKYRLLIQGVPSILLPDSARTNISVAENWLYPCAGPQVVEEENIPEEQGHGSNEEHEQMEEDQQQIHRGHMEQDWYARMEAEQQRQGAQIQELMRGYQRQDAHIEEMMRIQQRQDSRMEDILRGGQRQEEMLAIMMQSMNLRYPPPGAQ